MEKLNNYRSILRRIVTERAKYTPSHGIIETVAICDDQQEHYLMVHLGWSEHYRHDQPILHLRLHNGKVWVERDGSAEGVVNLLLEAGIPPEDIVQAYLRPSERELTEFAVE